MRSGSGTCSGSPKDGFVGVTMTIKNTFFHNNQAKVGAAIHITTDCCIVDDRCAYASNAINIYNSTFTQNGREIYKGRYASIPPAAVRQLSRVILLIVTTSGYIYRCTCRIERLWQQI